jgi:hypothetical protein
LRKKQRSLSNRGYTLRHIASLLIVAGFALAWLAGCTGPSEPEVTGPYSDPNDHSTTAVVTNLVQIETGGTMGLINASVEAYLCVTDQEGLPLENFNHYNFAVVESSAAGRVEIGSGGLTAKSVAQTGQGTATAVVMDYTDDMPDNLIADMESAVKLFIMFMGSGDVAEIIKYSYYPGVVQSFTSDKDQLNAAVEEPWAGPGGGSALIDAVYTGLSDASTRDELSAVYAMSLGWESSSQHTLDELRQLADSSGIPCYTFGMGAGDTLKLSEIADLTGGRFFYVPELEDPTKVYELLTGMLKKTYVLEWTIQSPSGSEVHVTITTEYTCGNGTLTSTATGTFVAP